MQEGAGGSVRRLLRDRHQAGPRDGQAEAGGQGARREVCEVIVRAPGKRDTAAETPPPAQPLWREEWRLAWCDHCADFVAHLKTEGTCTRCGAQRRGAPW